MKGIAVVLVLVLWAGLMLAALPVIKAEAPAAALTEPGRNPIGVMLGGGGLRIDRRVALARDLGAAYFRPWDVDTADWNGQSPDAERFRAAGFPLILTVRHGGQGGPPPTPASPPKDLASYRQTIGEVLDRYRPAVLVVENEENSRLFYSGTPAEYETELRAACDVARSKGVPCTNGGMVSTLVALLVWDHYKSTAQISRAESFAARAFDAEQRRRLASPRAQARVAESVEKGKQLLAVYRRAGLDYMNFHWYIPDPEALREAVDFLREATGLQPMTNEIGQHDTDPEVVRSLLAKAVELKLPYIIWFSLDRTARALQDADGTLRPNGKAFGEFVRARFG